jgi:holo-[acyl-carrier protein] synthase
VSVGIDLLDVGRLERALARRPGLAARLFTDGERAYADTKARPAVHLAARFCAKEAVTKALALPHLAPLEIEVAHADSGAPEVALSGNAARVARERNVTVEVSLTHERHLAAAVAVLRPAPSGPTSLT